MMEQAYKSCQKDAEWGKLDWHHQIVQVNSTYTTISKEMLANKLVGLAGKPRKKRLKKLKWLKDVLSNSELAVYCSLKLLESQRSNVVEKMAVFGNLDGNIVTTW